MYSYSRKKGNTMQETKKMNPLVALAAISVTLFSLVGIAVMTGVMPNSLSKSSETAVQSAVRKAPETGTTAKAEASPAQVRKDTSREKNAAKPAAQSTARTADASPAAPSKAAPVCSNCGTVTGVEAIKQQGEGTGLGAVAGGVVGGLLGNQVGGGSGKKIATVAGAAGGAYAGHQVEKHLKSTTRYDVTVKMDDGSLRTFSYDAQPAFQPGSKVRIVNGTLTAD
jgi:outer membrane lipoprotein SlyB